MTTVSPDSKPVGPSEIAKDWGSRGHPVSRQYASKCINKLGCPKSLTDEWKARGCATALDATWLWRTERTDISKLAGGGGATAENFSAPHTHIPGASAVGETGHMCPVSVSAADSVDIELERVRTLVELHFRQWQTAIVARPYDAFAVSAARKDYREALNTRLDVEGLIADYKKSSGELVDLSHGQRLIDERLAPFRSALHGLDRALAVDLHPEDPAKYRPLYRAVLRRVLLPAITNAKRPLRPTPPHGRRAPALAA